MIIALPARLARVVAVLLSVLVALLACTRGEPVAVVPTTAVVAPPTAAPPSPTAAGATAPPGAAIASQTTGAAPPALASAPPTPPSPAPTGATAPAGLATPPPPVPAGDITPVLRQLAVQAEAGLRSGQFEATIDYGNGTRATTRMRFDLADLPRLHSAATYESPRGTRTDERLVIGGQAWARQDGGAWSPTRVEAGLLEQVYAYLPGTAAAGQMTALPVGIFADLFWYDAARNADVALSINATTGTPRHLRRVARRTGEVLTVAYQGWNTPVDIAPPA